MQYRWRRPRSLFLAMTLVVCVGLSLPAALIGVLVVGVREPPALAQHQQQQLQAHLDLLASSLAELLWNLDAVAAREVVEAATKSPDVVRVQVTDLMQNKPFVDLLAPGRKTEGTISGERDIVRRNRLIGRVRIDIDDSVAAATVGEQRRFFALIVSAQVLVSLALILALLHSRVLRPLRELGRFAGHLAEGNFSAALPLRKDDEIGQLGERLEHMRDALQRLFGEQRALLQRVRDEEARTHRQAQFYAALSRSNQLIVRGPGEQALYADICRICVDTGHARMACIWLLDGPQMHIAGTAGPADTLFRAGRASSSVMPSLIGTVLEGRPWVCNDYLADARPADNHRVAADFGVRAAAAFPVCRGGRVVGALELCVGQPAVFDEAMVSLLTEMAGDLSFALDNIDRETARVEALHQVEIGFERFRRIFGATPASIFILALDDGTILEANPVACERYARSREAMIGSKWAELGIGPSEDARRQVADRVVRDGSVRDFESRVRTRSDEWRDVVVNAEYISFGGRDCMLTIATDITERKRMERALRNSEARLSGIVETAMDAMVTVDTEQRIVVFNRAASQMFRIPAMQALGSPLERFIRPARPGPEAEPPVGLRADGESFPIAMSAWHSGDGEDQLTTIVARDTTGEIEARRAGQARLAAEAASQAKTEFLSRMSHELRTPLNAVLGFSQLLKSEAGDSLSERQSAQLASIHQAGWHLLALINDVLDVSLIEAGRLEVNPSAVPLTGLLDDVLALLRTSADRQGVVMHALYLGQPPAQVWGDPVRVRQVLLNVVSNAVKYNRPGGSVSLSVALSAREVCVQVSDTGLGMTSEQLAHLYEPFNRLGREQGHIEGTGIGMALTRQLVQLMQGTIEVDSTPELGSTVRVTLPAVHAAPAAEPAEEDANGPDPQGVVLYIEDNPVNMLIVEQALARWPGVQLAQADHGRQGIEMARRLQPDLVLLDMRLPDMDGIEVLQALGPAPGGVPLHVVALSASAMPEDAERARQSGAADYWTKPLDLKRFIADVRRLLA